MTPWFRWREMRARFLVLAVLTALASFMIGGYTPAHVVGQLMERDAAGQLALRLHRIGSEWFGNKGPSVAILLGAIFLTVGGPMTEPGRGSTLFAAALPVTRRRMLLNQAGVMAGLTALLALIGVVMSHLGGRIVGVAYPLVPALAGALVQVMSALPFAGVLLAAQAITRRAISSTIALLGLALVAPPLLGDLAPPGPVRRLFSELEFPPMIPWEPTPDLHLLAGAALLRAMPWPALAAALAIAVTGAAIALAVFERREL